MKKLVILCMLTVFSFGVYAQTERGQSSVGLTLGYGFDTENPTIGLDYRYSLTNYLRINPSVSHYIKNDGLSAWAIDLNAHYLVGLSEQFSFYPIVGVDLSFWDQKIMKEPRESDASISNTRFGVNLGLGVEMYATERITVGLEAKYAIVKDYDQAWIGLRAGYSF